MTDTQLYLAIGVTVVLNATMIGLLAMLLLSHMNARFEDLNRRMDHGFEAVNQRFNDMRNLWLAELHRVEGILDAR